MEKEIRIDCPCCESLLIIDRVTGKVLECRKPLVEESSGDRLSDALQKEQQDKEQRAGFFDNIKEQQEKKKQLAEDLFDASLKDAKEQHDVKPDSIFDAD